MCWSIGPTGVQMEAQEGANRHFLHPRRHLCHTSTLRPPPPPYLNLCLPCWWCELCRSGGWWDRQWQSWHHKEFTCGGTYQNAPVLTGPSCMHQVTALITAPAAARLPPVPVNRTHAHPRRHHGAGEGAPLPSSVSLWRERTRSCARQRRDPCFRFGFLVALPTFGRGLPISANGISSASGVPFSASAAASQRPSASAILKFLENTARSWAFLLG